MRILRMIPLAVAAGTAAAMLIADPSMAAISHSAAAGQHSRLRAAASKAAVDAAPNSCSSLSGGPWVCIYADAGYDLGPGKFNGTNSQWGTDFGSSGNNVCVAGKTAASDNRGGWNDCVSSIYNNTHSTTFAMYVNPGCANGGGDKLLLAAGSGVSDLNNHAAPNGDSSYWNDSLTSDIDNSGGNC